MFKTLLNERVLSFNSTAQLISIKLDRHVHNFILQTPIIFVLSLYKNRGFRRQKCEGTKSEKTAKNHVEYHENKVYSFGNFKILRCRGLKSGLKFYIKIHVG